MKKHLFLCGSVVMAAVLTLVFFHGVSAESFLFLHDEYLPFPEYEVGNQFFTRTFLDLGTSATTQMIVTFLDRLYYTVAYAMQLKMKQAQVLLYVIKLFSIIYLPYFGFVRLARVFVPQMRRETVGAISLWYTFNTYTVIYWHGNAFSLPLLVCYSLAPLAFYGWERLFFSAIDFKSRVKWTLILVQTLFLMSFALYLFAPFVLLLLGYTVLRVLFLHKWPTDFCKRFAAITVLATPVFVIHFMVLYEMFFLSADAKNTVGSETFGNLQGGLMFMELMWFTWPMYVIWVPRNVWTFTAYYQSVVAIFAPFVLYIQIVWGALRQRQNFQLGIFFCLFLTFLLLSKGPQEPFGDFYLGLLKYVPGFRVFRSPDTKFGFVIVFSTAMLLLNAGQNFRSRNFAGLILLVSLVQSWPLLNGLAIQGENTQFSHDRVIQIPDEYRQLADFMNNAERAFGYVTTIPTSEYARFQVKNGEEHAGQDLLSKMFRLPFVCASESTGMSRPAYERLSSILSSGNFGALRELGIRYYIFRRDLASTSGQAEVSIFIKGKYPSIFHNAFFTVYEDLSAPPIVEGVKDFNIVNPTRVDLKFGAEDKMNRVVLHQSYHPSWKLYSGGGPAHSNPFRHWGETISYLWKPSVAADASQLAYGYANSWAFIGGSSEESNHPVSATLFYFPQAVFYLLATISFFFFIIYFFIVAGILNRKIF